MQSDYTVEEGGSVEVHVILNGTFDRDVTVTFATEDGTAIGQGSIMEGQG